MRLLPSAEPPVVRVRLGMEAWWWPRAGLVVVVAYVDDEASTARSGDLVKSMPGF